MKAGFDFHITFSFSYLILIIVLKSCSSQYFDPAVDLNDTFFMPRVVNGYPAKLGDVPYQVGFKNLVSRRLRWYATFCGGVIIKESKLLSAAHCFESKKSRCHSRPSIVVSTKDLSRKLAVAGTLLNEEHYNPSNPGTAQWREMKYVAYPAKYKFPKKDICVVVLQRPFTFNANIGPIPYATVHKDYAGECLVSGYGRLSSSFSNNPIRSERLMLANLVIIPTYTCNLKHRQNMRHFVCTSDRLTSSSQGDSGGPLVCSNTGDPMDKGKGVLVGIVSGARKHAGGFFTRVSSYNKYINANRGSLSTPSSFYYFIALINSIFYLFYLCFITISKWFFVRVLYDTKIQTVFLSRLSENYITFK